MSLVISLTCALLATLLQQWARRYLKNNTQSRYSPHKRARIRAFFAEGVENCLLPWTVDALPTLLHLSLFLFFAGLVVFLCNVNLTIFKLVLSWVGLCTALYVCITCMPIIRHDSPYYTPLSLPMWHVVTGTLFFVYRFLRWFNRSVYSRRSFRRFRDLAISYRESLAQGMRKTAEETALNTSSEIDTRAFKWTFDCLDEDHELESFFSGLPGFRSSKVVKDPLPSLTEEEILKLYGALYGLLERTFSSDLLPTPVKNRRALICAKAVDPEHTPIDPDPEYLTIFRLRYSLPVREPKPTAFHILDMILSQYQHSGPVATGVAKVLRGWGNNMHEDTIVYAQLTICSVLTISQPRDDSWYNIASYELRLSETSLRDFAAQGDSLSFIVLIHLVRQQFRHFRKMSQSQQINFSRVLAEASELDATDTSSELQHRFCALWNQIVQEAQDGDDREMVYHILRPMLNVFLTLHQDTDSASVEFSAAIRNWERILGVPSSYPVCKVPHHRSRSVPASSIYAVPYDPSIPASVPSLTSIDPPSSSPYPPLPVDGTLTNTLPLDSHSTYSPSPKSNASAFSPADIAIGSSALSRAPSDDLNVRSSPSTPVLVLDAILPTGLLPFRVRLDLTAHSSILVTGAEAEDNTKTGVGMEEDASHYTFGVREEITASADLPHLSSPLAEVVIDDSSTRSLGTEHIEHRPPDSTVLEHSAVSHTPSSDVEVPSSPTPGLPIGMLFPLNSVVVPSEHAVLSLEYHSQMPEPAASGLSRSWDLSAAVEGEDNAKAALDLAPKLGGKG